MTLKQALWEIVRDENIIITNQNIDWLLDRASKKATGDAQALKESILERKQVIEENIPSALTNEEKVSENGKLLLINENKSNNSDFKSNNFDVKSNGELFKQALVEGVNRRIDREIEEAKKIEQIEEMAKDLCALNRECENCPFQLKGIKCNPKKNAERFIAKGYRKHTDRFLLKENGELIPLLPKRSEWISVDERLPEANTQVLAINSDGEFYVATYIEHKISPSARGYMTWASGMYNGKPTHWMPLPEAPKMTRKEDEGNETD